MPYLDPVVPLPTVLRRWIHPHRRVGLRDLGSCGGPLGRSCPRVMSKIHPDEAGAGHARPGPDDDILVVEQLHKPGHTLPITGRSGRLGSQRPYLGLSMAEMLPDAVCNAVTLCSPTRGRTAVRCRWARLDARCHGCVEFSSRHGQRVAVTAGIMTTGGQHGAERKHGCTCPGGRHGETHGAIPTRHLAGCNIGGSLPLGHGGRHPRTSLGARWRPRRSHSRVWSGRARGQWRSNGPAASSARAAPARRHLPQASPKWHRPG